MVGNNKETTSGCFIQLVSDHTKISHATRVTAVWLEQPNCFYGDISALGLHDITFFTPWYIITHDITILLNVENWAEVSAFFVTPLIMMADLLDDHACPCFYLQVQIRMPIFQMAVEIGSVSILGFHFLLTYAALWTVRRSWLALLIRFESKMLPNRSDGFHLAAIVRFRVWLHRCWH